MDLLIDKIQRTVRISISVFVLELLIVLALFTLHRQAQMMGRLQAYSVVIYGPLFITKAR